MQMNTGRKFKLCFLLLLGCYILPAQNKVPVKTTEMYAGIDVGSKGVKMSLVNIERTGQKITKYTVTKDTSINTDFISFTQPTFSNTLKALLNLFTLATRNFNVSKGNIFTVISSGIKGQAERENKMTDVKKLIDTFKIIIGEPNRTVPIIDVDNEARLTHLGIVPDSRRYTTFIIDIGSGNTKGGYFPNGNTQDFKLFQLNWGTKSVANETDKRLEGDVSLTNYQKNLTRVLAGPASKEIVYAVNVSNAYMMTDYVAFSGGIAWAGSTLMFPELLDNSIVTVTYDEVQKLYNKVARNYASVSENVMSQLYDGTAKEKQAVYRETKRVNQVFDQRSLMSGLGLLLGIMRQFEGIYDKKQFYLVKSGHVGWITAYVNQQLNKGSE